MHVKDNDSFRGYASHYIRTHKPRRKYLNPDLNTKKIKELTRIPKITWGN